MLIELADDTLCLSVLSGQYMHLGDLAIQFIATSLHFIMNDDAVGEDLLLTRSTFFAVWLLFLELGLAIRSFSVEGFLLVLDLFSEFFHVLQQLDRLLAFLLEDFDLHEAVRFLHVLGHFAVRDDIFLERLEATEERSDFLNRALHTFELEHGAVLSDDRLMGRVPLAFEAIVVCVSAQHLLLLRLQLRPEFL